MTKRLFTLFSLAAAFVCCASVTTLVSAQDRGCGSVNNCGRAITQGQAAGLWADYCTASCSEHQGRCSRQRGSGGCGCDTGCQTGGCGPVQSSCGCDGGCDTGCRGSHRSGFGGGIGGRMSGLFGGGSGCGCGCNLGCFGWPTSCAGGCGDCASNSTPSNSASAMNPCGGCGGSGMAYGSGSVISEGAAVPSTEASPAAEGNEAASEDAPEE